MAKDLVRTRQYIKKMIMMRTQIQAVSLKIQTLKSTHTMAQAMAGVTKVKKEEERRGKPKKEKQQNRRRRRRKEIMKKKEKMMMMMMMTGGTGGKRT